MSRASQSAFDEVADVVGGVVSTGADALVGIAGNLDDLEDLAEAAIETVVVTGRVGVRLVTGTFRFIGRHPREVLIGVGLVALALAIVRYTTGSRSESDTD